MGVTDVQLPLTSLQTPSVITPDHEIESSVSLQTAFYRMQVSNAENEVTSMVSPPETLDFRVMSSQDASETMDLFRHEAVFDKCSRTIVWMYDPFQADQYRPELKQYFAT